MTAGDPPRKVHLVSLGCPKNRVDSESMLGRLRAEGWEVVSEPADADAIVVNTCAFIEPATEESIDTILELAEHKATGSCQRLVVTGCLVQRYGGELAAELPEVDGFLGTGELERLGTIIDAAPGERPCHVVDAGWISDEPAARAGLWRPHSAYLKVTEGCHRRCSYCIIPTLRGGLRSRSRSSLVQEARQLAAGGVREICVVGQDTTAYGQDIGDRGGLPALLTELAAVPELCWIRVLYAHPRGVDDALLDVLASEPRICSYLDLPLQHASSEILRAMGRGMDREAQRRLIERIRSGVPGIVLRSTFMVGFPGESESDFQQLLELLRQARFEHAGAFRYHAEQGTSAAHLPQQVPEAVQLERLDVLRALQARIAASCNQALVGQRVAVLIDGPSEEHDLLLAGRLEGQAPEIDGVVELGQPPEGAQPGSLRQALITGASAVDLVGELLPTPGTAGG